MAKDLKQLLRARVEKAKRVIVKTPKTPSSTTLKVRTITKGPLSPKSSQQ